MNVLNKEKFNQYGKLKLYAAVCFGLFSLSMFAEGNKNPFNTRRVGDDVVKIDIIINKDDINDYEEDIEDTYKEEGDLIYLDQIEDEEENKIQKKNEKINKLEQFIRKVDEKFNPIIKFQIGKSYGIWYLLKTEDISETDLENIRYDFIQEQNGYKLIKSYFDPKSNVWSENNQRAWIEEKKGDVYLEVEKKYFKNNKKSFIGFIPLLSKPVSIIIHFMSFNFCIISTLSFGVEIYTSFPSVINLSNNSFLKLNRP